MWARIQRLLDRIESRVALWTALAQGLPVMSVGFISGWLSTGVEWINQFGWFGWWAAALTGALVAALILLFMALLRQSWIKASAIRSWSQNKGDAINPLDREFIRRRINLLDLVSPINNAIIGKRFIDCELLGPANLLMSRSTITDNSFARHDIVLMDTNSRVSNAILLEDCVITGCMLNQLTLLIWDSAVPHSLLDPSANWITVRPSIEASFNLPDATPES